MVEMRVSLVVVNEQISDWNELINNFVAVYQARLAGMDALITSGKFTK